MNNQRLTASIAVALFALSAPLCAEEKVGQFFATFDYYLAGDVADDIENEIQDSAEASTQTGDPATADTDTSNGVGGRIGYLRNLSRHFALGGSLGYVAGPTIDSELTFLSGGISGITGNANTTVKTSYLRFMAEGVGKLPLNEKVTLNLGLGLGAASAKMEQEGTVFLTNGFSSVSDSVDADESTIGFSWEISPSVDFHLEKVDLALGLRYSQFPKIKESDETVEIEEWNALGFFAGVKF